MIGTNKSVVRIWYLKYKEFKISVIEEYISVKDSTLDLAIKYNMRLLMHLCINGQKHIWIGVMMR